VPPAADEVRVTSLDSRAAAALGAVTALAGALQLAGAGPLGAAPTPLSAWLVVAGIALCWLAVRRRERRKAPAVSWPDALRAALAEDRLVLQAQPIVDLATEEAGRYELLLRLRERGGELLPPAAFLPAAERHDLIVAIDHWVVARAIALLAEERRRGRRLTFEVNISGRSTGDPELLALIEREFRAHDVDPSQLVFEITETSAVANIPRAQAFASRLAELGCRLALDDFGSGFASFYYLKHLPVDYLKIDGEFVRGCVADRTDQLVIQAVVEIARGLGKRTVAEMVGDEETLELVRDLGVDYVQGFHVGRPAPLSRWLPRHSVGDMVAVPSA
jgi:EAL domain-containing protein (putative c-di-GMP-specific phosphodiesterase class I)